jgi:phosphoribosylaminoimidazolecarboxamide formyltransferase/IMP cyclohydrolase
MVVRKSLESNALISVYDKSSLHKICLTLTKYNIGLISTGATAKKIISLGFNCREISNLTKFKEILDGRVKTLNPKIHASLLFKRNNSNHKKTFEALNFPKIDFVIVNFYPFTKTSNTNNSAEKIEMIDIGGPSLIRSASKNFESITTICKKKYYEPLIRELKLNHGKTSLAFRKKMAEKNFKVTSDYDLSIFKWFKKNNKKKIKNIVKLKYGENPNQKSYFVKNSKFNIFNSQVSGKKIGYNNILDISEGLSCLYDFVEPTCVIVKHNNPSGVASAKNIKRAYLKALKSDPLSAFGGVLLLNKQIDNDLAKIINNNFFEVVVAPKINKQTIEVLKSRVGLIIIDSLKLKEKNITTFRSVKTGVLHQETNSYKITRSNIKLVTNKKASKKIIDDLLFAFKVAKHVKSNAIVLVNNKQTLGIGAGQMSRLDSTRMAIIKYKDFFKDKSFVCASDAFFPFTDSIKLLQKLNCCGIIQPSGSKNDLKIIAYSKSRNIPLYFVKNRIFKH